MKLTPLAVLSLGLLLAIPLRAQEVSAEKRAEIERLLAQTNALAMGQQMSRFFVNHMAQVIRKQNPQAPQQVLDALPEEVNAAIAESLPYFAESIIPVYDKHFTLEELRGLNAFYSSALGKKVISAMPLVVQESMAKGAQWGEALGPRINQRIRERFKKENLAL